MADSPPTEKIYERFITLSQDAFAAGLYESAYHSLDAAFHCAVVLQSTLCLQKIITLAAEQSAWIDREAPDSVMSTQSAGERRLGVNFYATLIHKAQAYDTFLKRLA